MVWRGREVGLVDGGQGGGAEGGSGLSGTGGL